MDGLDIATLLARAGGAISQDGSWQQNLAGAAGETAANEQERKYLSQMIGGNVPDPTGRFGLDPDTVLKGLQLRQQIEESRPKPVQMTQVETPWGVETMPAEEAPEYRRKLFNEQNETDPTNVREFEWLSEQPKDVQKSYMDYLEKRRGPNAAQTLAEMLKIQDAKQRKRAETEKKITYGTSEHFDEVGDRYEDADLSRMYSNYSARVKKQGRIPPSSNKYYEMVKLNEMAKDIEDSRDDIGEVRYERGSEGEGFYGTTSEGERVLIQKFQRRTR